MTGAVDAVAAVPPVLVMDPLFDLEALTMTAADQAGKGKVPR